MGGKIMPHWIVAKTKGNRERYAAENVHRQGYEFYLPMLVSYRGRGRLKHAIVTPVFPSYLFVQIEDTWRFLLGTFGVTSIILNGKAPAILPLSVVTALKKREDNGFYSPAEMKQGSQIRISSGSFIDTLGIYQGQSAKERALILMEFLGGKRTVEIDNECIELVA
jgi:transcriptional antiterminator RfaH